MSQENEKNPLQIYNGFIGKTILILLLLLFLTAVTSELANSLAKAAGLLLAIAVLPWFLYWIAMLALSFSPGRKEDIRSVLCNLLFHICIILDRLLLIIPGNPYALGFPKHLTGLAMSYAYMGDDEKGYRALKESIAFIERTDGENSALLSEPLMLMIGLERDTNRHEDCKKSIDRYMNYLVQHADNLSPIEVSSAYCDAAVYLAKVGEVEESAALANKADLLHSSNINPLILEEIIPTHLNNIALVHAYNENFEKAYDCMSKKLELIRKKEGKEMFTLAISQSNICWILNELGRSEEALAAGADSVQIFEQLKIKDPRYRVVVLENYGEALLRNGALEEAKKILEESFALALIQHQKSPADLGASYRAMGKLFSELKDWQKAELHFRKALELIEPLVGQEHPRYKKWQAELESSKPPAQP